MPAPASVGRVRGRARAARSGDTGRTARPVRALVPVEPEPAQVVEHARLARRRVERSTSVSSMRSTNVPPCCRANSQLKQRGAGAADVQPAGGAGREANAHGRSSGRDRSTSATAHAAIPRRGRARPSVSLVVALTDTRVGVDLQRARDAAHIAFTPARVFGASATTVASTLTTRAPAASTSARIRRSRSRLEASFHRGRRAGSACRGRRAPAAPEQRVADRVAQHVGIAVAVESPVGLSNLTPPSTSGRPVRVAMDVVADVRRGSPHVTAPVRAGHA